MTDPPETRRTAQPVRPGPPAGGAGHCTPWSLRGLASQIPRSAGARNAKPQSSCARCGAKRSLRSAATPPCACLDWSNGASEGGTVWRRRCKPATPADPAQRRLGKAHRGSANWAWRSNGLVPGARERALLPGGGRAQARRHLPGHRPRRWRALRRCRVGLPARATTRTIPRRPRRPRRPPPANAAPRPRSTTRPGSR